MITPILEPLPVTGETLEAGSLARFFEDLDILTGEDLKKFDAMVAEGLQNLGEIYLSDAEKPGRQPPSVEIRVVTEFFAHSYRVPRGLAKRIKGTRYVFPKARLQGGVFVFTVEISTITRDGQITSVNRPGPTEFTVTAMRHVLNLDVGKVFDMPEEEEEISGASPETR